jgi:hypothetical protein
MSKISVMCQPKKIFKRNVSYDASVSPLGIIPSDYLWDFRVSGVLLFRFVGIPEARSSEVTIKDFLLILRKLLNFGDH